MLVWIVFETFFVCFSNLQLFRASNFFELTTFEHITFHNFLGRGSLHVRLRVFSSVARCLRTASTRLRSQGLQQSSGRIRVPGQPFPRYQQKHSHLLHNRAQSQHQTKSLLHCKCSKYTWLDFKDDFKIRLF